MSRFKAIVTFALSIFNPNCFLYRLHHYKNTPVSLDKALKISKKNHKYYEKRSIDLFEVNTYDGSGQATHPHCLMYKDKCWLVLTPYPYGMEEYENPCVFVGDSFSDLKEFANNPIAFQKKHKQGYHLSDPCFFTFADKLYCAYRNSERANGTTTNYILCKEILFDENKYGEENLIFCSINEKLLSPAFFENNGYLYMIYVENDDGKSILKMRKFDKSFKEVHSDIIECGNMPTDYSLWHIDVNNDANKTSLFLLVNNKNPEVYKLYYAHCEDLEKHKWTIDKELLIDDNVLRIMKCPYKSALIPNSSDVLLSI